MCSKPLQLVVFILPLIIETWAMPISVLQNEHPPLAAEISSHLSSHGARLQDTRQDPRLPLPSPQDIETIRRIAEVLVMFGQQPEYKGKKFAELNAALYLFTRAEIPRVIPAIIGPSSTASTTTAATLTEIPNDAVNAI